jgi:hypothetical protein
VSTTGAPYAVLAGALGASAVIGTAGFALWTYGEGATSWKSWIARSTSGFTVGWAIGILAGGASAFINNTSYANGWLDNVLNQAWTTKAQLQATT